jgi:hypothetical protein
VCGAVTLEPEDLAGGAECHQELDRLVDVLADGDRLVAAVKRDVRVAGGLEDGGGGVGVGHRERPWSAGWLVVFLGPGGDLLDDRLGAVDPVVVDSASPDHHHERAARREREADVAQRYDRVGEEHGAEAGEGHLVRPSWNDLLNIGDFERGVLDAGLFGFLACGVDEPPGGVDTDRFAFRPDEGSESLGGVAETAADVQHALAATWWV